MIVMIERMLNTALFRHPVCVSARVIICEMRLVGLIFLWFFFLLIPFSLPLIFLLVLSPILYFFLLFSIYSIFLLFHLFLFCSFVIFLLCFTRTYFRSSYFFFETARDHVIICLTNIQYRMGQLAAAHTNPMQRPLHLQNTLGTCRLGNNMWTYGTM